MIESQPPIAQPQIPRPLPIFAVSLLLGLLFNYLLFGIVPGVGYGIFIAAIVAGTVLLVMRFRGRLTPAARWFAALSVLFAMLVGVRASYELTFMNVVLSLALLLLAAVETVGDRIRTFPLGRYASLGWLPFYFIGNIVLFFGAWFRKRIDGKHRNLGSVIRGVFLALPVLVVFALLFSSADLVFRNYLQATFHFNMSPETVARIVFIIVVTLLFLGTFWFIFTFRRKEHAVAENAVTSNGLGRTETHILLWSVNALFLLFIAVQLAYLFGGERSIVGQGFTYAAYARRGFFELIVVAVISWILAWAIDRTVGFTEPARRRMTKFLLLALVLQVVVVMVSAFMRLVLYEQAYGFTTLRFYSHVFIVWLAVAFVLLLYKVFVSRREPALAFAMLITVLVFAAGVDAFNPDAFIARQNVQRYATTGKIDIFYLDALSPDAIPAIMPILDVDDAATVKAAASRLYWKQYRMEQSKSGWQGYNISRRTALRLLDGERELLEANKEYIIPYDTIPASAIDTD